VRPSTTTGGPPTRNPSLEYPATTGRPARRLKVLAVGATGRRPLALVRPVAADTPVLAHPRVRKRWCAVAIRRVRPLRQLVLLVEAAVLPAVSRSGPL